MAKLRIVVRELDRMTLGTVNGAEIDDARQHRRAELLQHRKDVVGEFIPTPKTLGFNWNLVDAYQRKGWSSRSIANIIIAQFIREGLREFSPEEIEVNYLCVSINGRKSWFGK
jgi:hypothetical protein